MSRAGRLDQELASRGLAPSRTRAAALVRQGLVTVDGRPADRPSQKVTPETVIALDEAADRWVSRAAHKLLGALEAFPTVDPAVERALDAGASTGGFTQVLLEHGARHVVAVDVGHDQLVAKLREDPRVQVHEGLNVRHLDVAEIGGPVDLVVADLSFISLTLVVEALAGACRPGARLLLMVKPQFEVGRERLPRTGVVVDPDHRRQAVTDVVAACLRAGLEVAGLARSPLPGQDGNVEVFLHARRPAAPVVAGEGRHPEDDDAAHRHAEQLVDAAGIDWS